MPYPGETLSSSLQFRARKLLVWIAGKSPHSIEEIEAEFAKLQGRTIRPSIRFFLSKSLLVMAIRVVYVIGVKRIAVALTRESTGNIPTSQTGEKMFPVHILSFAGTFVSRFDSFAKCVANFLLAPDESLPLVSRAGDAW